MHTDNLHEMISYIVLSFVVEQFVNSFEQEVTCIIFHNLLCSIFEVILLFIGTNNKRSTITNTFAVLRKRSKKQVMERYLSRNINQNIIFFLSCFHSSLLKSSTHKYNMIECACVFIKLIINNHSLFPLYSSTEHYFGFSFFFTKKSSIYNFVIE